MRTDHTLLESLCEITLEAAALALKRQGSSLPELKEDNSTVTEVDREVESLLRDQLAVLLPEAAFIGEESATDPGTLRQARSTEWVWVVDPIDGTALFSAGLDAFCVCVGLLRHGRPWSGVVALPALDQVYRGQDGLGAWCNETPIRVLEHSPPPDRAFLCLSRNSHQYLDVSDAFRVLSFGSTACNFVQVARGTVVGAVGRSHAWDHAAPAAIIHAAGGVLRHQNGREVDWLAALDGALFEPPLVAASPALWEQVAGGITCRR